MKRILLFSICLLTSFSMQAANSVIAKQPTSSDKTTETLAAIIGIHCIDAYTDPLTKNCPRSTRWGYSACKTFVCMNLAYGLSNEITTTCGVNDDPLIKSFLMVGINFGSLQLIRSTQARFGIKRKND